VIVYRGISADDDFDKQITARGFEVESEIMAGNDDVYVGNESLTMYPSKSNSANLHNVCSVKYLTGWLSCSFDYETAYKFATHCMQPGIVLTLDIPDDIFRQINYIEHNPYAIENHESEVLLDMTNLKDRRLPKSWIIKKDYFDI